MTMVLDPSKKAAAAALIRAREEKKVVAVEATPVAAE